MDAQPPGTAAGILKAGRLAPVRVVPILPGVAQALDYAHENLSLDWN